MSENTAYFYKGKKLKISRQTAKMIIVVIAILGGGGATLNEYMGIKNTQEMGEQHVDTLWAEIEGIKATLSGECTTNHVFG